ncbi:ABC transporter ATP-binding protein [Bradyrhizobium jicamae]|uniref:ABC transporter ATP-binding protein n=1 Tax=Bradyrhizobium jicamae TaxID=280332 RepID=A0ABS5FSA4_9BRAD|nr:ABC transporter ATP-binding protein [Bradyrhizobium jicamae]MBR0799631.1 ABC transporter ATP-binding protein [Bradyrhizobium jicamae]
MKAPPSLPLLSANKVDAGYGHVRVLEKVSIDVRQGRIVVLVGRNGAGKSTLLRALSGLNRPTSGTITFDRRDITGARPNAIVGAGLLHVAEGRRLFRRQSVTDNIELGRYGLRLTEQEHDRRVNRIHELFPILQEKRDLPAGSLSGGQQQMLAIAQAMMREPKLLMLDEPSLGLAPVLVDQVLAAILSLRAQGVAILLVEQMVERALEIADDAYVMQNGRVIAGGLAADIAAGDALQAAFMGEHGTPDHSGPRWSVS